MAIFTHIAGAIQRLVSGLYVATAPTLSDGQVYPLRVDAGGRLIVVSSAGVDAIHSAGTSAALAGGANTITAYTVSAGRFLTCTSVVCLYTGTMAGVTLQAQIGGVVAGVRVSGLVSGQYVNLLEPGTVINGDPAETIQILVAGATAADTITWAIQGDEMTI